jgi:hypothetical protein
VFTTIKRILISHYLWSPGQHRSILKHFSTKEPRHSSLAWVVPHQSQWSIASTLPQSPYAFPSGKHGSRDHMGATPEAGEAAIATTFPKFADTDDTTRKEYEN